MPDERIAKWNQDGTLRKAFLAFWGDDEWDDEDLPLAPGELIPDVLIAPTISHAMVRAFEIDPSDCGFESPLDYERDCEWDFERCTAARAAAGMQEEDFPSLEELYAAARDRGWTLSKCACPYCLADTHFIATPPPFEEEDVTSP